jgi:O-succinylbenzoate synthase
VSPGAEPGSLAFTLPSLVGVIRSVELLRVRLPLTQPFRTASGTTAVKDALLVRVVTPDASGWGECTRQSRRRTCPRPIDTGRVALRDELVPRLFAGAASTRARAPRGQGRAHRCRARRAAPRRRALAGDAPRRHRHARRRRGRVGMQTISTHSAQIVAATRPRATAA